MGNRAVITTKDKRVGIYLHWNGGRDSVEAFLAYCKLRGFRSPETDCYGFARLAQVICNFIGGDLSIGVDTLDKLDCDNGDNGLYIIEDWTIIGREFMNSREQQEYDLKDMLIAINNAQPNADRLASGVIESHFGLNNKIGG